MPERIDLNPPSPARCIFSVPQTPLHDCMKRRRAPPSRDIPGTASFFRMHDARAAGPREACFPRIFGAVSLLWPAFARPASRSIGNRYRRPIRRSPLLPRRLGKIHGVLYELPGVSQAYERFENETPGARRFRATIGPRLRRDRAETARPA
jgi:hypothetical protein